MDDVRYKITYDIFDTVVDTSHETSIDEVNFIDPDWVIRVAESMLKQFCAKYPQAPDTTAIRVYAVEMTGDPHDVWDLFDLKEWAAREMKKTYLYNLRVSGCMDRDLP